MINLNKCQVGDKLVLNNGQLVEYAGVNIDYDKVTYPHLLKYTNDNDIPFLVTYTDNGRRYTWVSADTGDKYNVKEVLTQHVSNPVLEAIEEEIKVLKDRINVLEQAKKLLIT
jgi:hypothetical protein